MSVPTEPKRWQIVGLWVALAAAAVLTAGDVFFSWPTGGWALLLLIVVWVWSHEIRFRRLEWMSYELAKSSRMDLDDIKALSAELTVARGAIRDLEARTRPSR